MSIAQPYGYYVPSGGQPPSVNYTQPGPAMVPAGYVPGPMVYGGQPPYYHPPGGGQRGRSRGDSSNLVVQVKAQIGLAKPGQLLEISRAAASQLAISNPKLYSDFLNGLGLNPKNVAYATVSLEEGEKVKEGIPKGKPPAPKVSGTVVTERIQAWKEACKSDERVQAWEEIQVQYKKAQGENCQVDREILTDSPDQIKAYMVGKVVREDILKKCGLMRVPGGVAPDPDYIVPKEEILEFENPMSKQDRWEVVHDNQLYLEQKQLELARDSEIRLTQTIAMSMSAMTIAMGKIVEDALRRRDGSPPKPPQLKPAEAKKEP